jgi:hypothetical protein
VQPTIFADVHTDMCIVRIGREIQKMILEAYLLKKNIIFSTSEAVSGLF